MQSTKLLLLATICAGALPAAPLRVAIVGLNHGHISGFLNGGNLVVQYQSGEFDHNLGPYPYALSVPGRIPERVVDETSPVTFNSKDPLLSWPNQITPADFDGWVEERGHSFIQTWDPRYTAPTETHDPGQDPQRGGLLYARVGKGTYIYVAFALYRETPEAVPGAYRLLANLISAGSRP